MDFKTHIRPLFHFRNKKPCWLARLANTASGLQGIDLSANALATPLCTTALIFLSFPGARREALWPAAVGSELGGVLAVLRMRSGCAPSGYRS